MTGFIRGTTILGVIFAAIVAGWLSYAHAYEVVLAHGEHGTLAKLYPGTVDGLVYTTSMVLLDAARRTIRPPALARWLLVLGIIATLVANVWAGLRFGFPGAVIAAWPAVALVGSYEMLLFIIRGQAADALADAPEVAPVSVPPDRLLPAPGAAAGGAPKSTNGSAA